MRIPTDINVPESLESPEEKSLKIKCDAEETKSAFIRNKKKMKSSARSQNLDKFKHHFMPG